jgi:hypothetical protein
MKGEVVGYVIDTLRVARWLGAVVCSFVSQCPGFAHLCVDENSMRIQK